MADPYKSSSISCFQLINNQFALESLIPLKLSLNCKNFRFEVVKSSNMAKISRTCHLDSREFLWKSDVYCIGNTPGSSSRAKQAHQSEGRTRFAQDLELRVQSSIYRQPKYTVTARMQNPYNGTFDSKVIEIQWRYVIFEIIGPIYEGVVPKGNTDTH
jgi:hypothetical protein